MRKQERADYVRGRLAELYPETPIPLDHSDEFTLLVAVVLSAQCTDKKVNEITPDLFAAGGDPQSMADLGRDEILKIIRPLGLAPQKAKALEGLSRQLLAEHDGQVPNSFSGLEALPGVGHKTASVVMSQAFGVPAFPVDTHIHRLAQRWGLTKGKNVAMTERDLKKV
ncbi:MAG: endonuclease III, partial [Planctomycetota bacterium]